MFRKTCWIPLVVAGLLMAFSQSARAGDELFWDAYAEMGDVVMEASYGEFYHGDLVDQKFEVKIWNAPPLTRLKIYVRNTALGVIQTDMTGFGKFEKERFDVPLDMDGRPAAPRIETGYLIRVGRPGNFIKGEFMPR